MKYRYQVSEAFKQECKSNFATSRQGKIHIVEDNIDITGENYEGKLVDFTIDDNCYVNDKFIGTTVSKKITVNILNPNNEINLENKTIKPYAGINNEYVPFSTFIIEKPENKEYEEKTSFTGYDYMVKFKTPYVDTNTYPTTIGNILKNLCNFVGVECGKTTFVNSDYVVMGNPFTNNEECTLVLSNIAQLAGGFAHIGRDDKLYIVNIGELIKGLSVENVHEIQVSNLNETLIRYFKNDSGTNIIDEIDGNTYYTLQKNLIYGEVNKVTLNLDDNIDGEETSLSDEKSIKDNGLTEIIITGNYFLTNENDRKIAIEQLWETLRYLKYLPFKIEKYYGFPYLDVGDAISIVDSKDTVYRSYIFNHSFKYDGGFIGSIETTAMTKTQEQYKPITVKEKFRKVELSVDKINGEITAIIDKQTEDEEKIAQMQLDIDGLDLDIKNNKQETDEALQKTRTELETKIQVSAEGVESNVSKTLESYSTTEETNQSISNAKTEAINSANTSTDNKLKNYSTTTQMNSAITQKADEITSTVSANYSTKTETEEQISSAKSEIKQTTDSITTEVDKKVNDSEFGTKIEQNYESVKIAWNTISEFIQFISAQLQIKDSNKKLLMVLDKLGQHFYNSSSKIFAEMGVKTVNSDNYIAFSVPSDYNKSISDGMAWGVTTTSDNKFFPILFLKNFFVGNKDADNYGGELILNACDLVLSGMEKGIKSGDVKIYGNMFNGITFEDTNTGQVLLDITPANSSLGIDDDEILIFDKMKFYKNVGGSNSFKIGNNSYVLMTDEGNLQVQNGNVLFGTSSTKVGFDLYVKSLANITGNLNVNGNVYANNISSDRRIKKNIKDSEKSALDLIMQIKHRQFEKIEDNKHYDIGYIAQEMEEIDPNFVMKREKTENSDEKYYINELPIIATITKAIQEQQKQIEEQQKEIEQLKAKIKEMEEK